MKLYLISIIKFIIFATLAVIIGLNVWVQVLLWLPNTPTKALLNARYILGAYGHMHSRVRDIDNYENVDILVLGSSHAYRGFDPRIFWEYELELFNLGSSAQTPMQTELLLKKYFDKLNPRVVLFEVYPGAFTSDGIESTIDIISNGHLDKHDVDLAVRVNNLIVYNVLIITSCRQALNLDNSFNEKVEKHSDIYISGGYVEKDIHYYPNDSLYDDQTWIFNESQVEAFENILEFFGDRGVKVILVYAPITKNLYNSYTNNEEVDRFFESTGQRYYNLNKIVELLPELHFYDNNHLNQHGVQLMNRFLIDILVTDGML